MSTTKIPLDLISVASPCTAPWDAMSGDDTTRFCGQCSQYVYNLSEMSQADAEALIEQQEGKLCIRFYKRSDGTMMTKDCPVGWRAIKRRVVLVGGAAVAVFVAAFGMLTFGAFAASVRGNGRGGVELVNPITRIRDMMFPPPVCVMGEAPIRVAPQPVNDPPPNLIMGKMCPPENLQPPVPEPPQPPVVVEDGKK